jgi:hypothetical protein
VRQQSRRCGISGEAAKNSLPPWFWISRRQLRCRNPRCCAHCRRLNLNQAAPG